MENSRIAVLLLSFITVHAVYGHDHLNALLAKGDGDYNTNSSGLVSASGAANATPPQVFHVTAYGADPTGKVDSTNAIIAAISDALKLPGNGFLMNGIVNLGGARIDLDGGSYLISSPIQFPVSGRGNLLIHGGSLKASNSFPNGGYLIDLSPASSSSLEYYYEFVTLRDLLLDSNYRGGGIQVVKSVRINIDNCYITHFSTVGISVKGGHETSIRHSYLGQHITAGGDPGERNFTGTGIELLGNDNSINDVVIFSAALGIMITGQANIISEVHCYNKATGFGGTGIYLKLPGLTQTRIVNSYFDFTGIVAEDPVQLTISNSFFLGDAYIVLKSIKGVANGVNIVDNMFSGSGKGIDTVQLDQKMGPFKQINQIVIDGNNVNGMNLKSTIARTSVQGNGSSWVADFNSALVFPNLIKRVDYTFITGAATFPVHVLRNVSGNKVVIQSQSPVPASVFITADQGV
ncbi:LOW QUALITY PROTEIN: polygalacturonase QRT3-like [Primulina tabacum]|uniref:LOW QUALITY PROTEIN: polygalacturonase QRT3-like n=1 Tax=Primulina tabacum TaxID=48773 RepID=UPI003F599E59